MDIFVLYEVKISLYYSRFEVTVWVTRPEYNNQQNKWSYKKSEKV